MEKGNVLAVLVGVMFCVGMGRIIEFWPQKKVLEETKEETKRIITMKVTAYCPCAKCCGKYADGQTAIGRNAKTTLGVAADPKLLPYGTKLNIPGIGIREIDDTGGAMRQNAKKGICHIDVRFHNHETAKRFGVQWLNVEILSPVN